jgi:hypothetical protein
LTISYISGWAVDSDDGPLIWPVQTTVPASDTFFIGGGAYKGLGHRYAKIIAGAVPAGAFFIGGIAHTSDGAMYAKNTAPAVPYKSGPFTLDSDGAMYVKPFGTKKYWSGGFPFDEDGGLVSRSGDIGLIWEMDASRLTVAPDIGTGTPTFTRSSSATFVGSNGLIQSAVNDVPRFDYDPVTLAIRGLLVEEARTNLVRQSEALATSPWTVTGVVVTNNYASAAGLSFSRLTNANGGPLEQVITFTGDGTKCLSIYARQDGTAVGDHKALIVDSTAATTRATVTITVAAGGVITAGISGGTILSVDTINSGVYRVRASVGGIIAANTNRIYAADSGGATLTAIQLAGVQVEDSPFPTTYIPTTTAAVARSADVCTLATSLIGGFDATKVTTYGEVISGAELDDTTNARYIATLGDGATQSAALRESPVGTTFFGEIRVPAGFDTGTLLITKRANKVALAIQAGANNAISSLNGVLTTASSPTSMPTMTTLYIGNEFSAAFLCSAIRKLRLYSRRLTNAELQALTA